MFSDIPNKLKNLIGWTVKPKSWKEGEAFIVREVRKAPFALNVEDSEYIYQIGFDRVIDRKRERFYLYVAFENNIVIIGNEPLELLWPPYEQIIGRAFCLL